MTQFYCNVPNVEVKQLLLLTLEKNGFDIEANRAEWIWNDQIGCIAIYTNTGHTGGNSIKDALSVHFTKISLEEAFELKFKKKLMMTDLKPGNKFKFLYNNAILNPDDLTLTVLSLSSWRLANEGGTFTPDLIPYLAGFSLRAMGKIEASHTEVVKL